MAATLLLIHNAPKTIQCAQVILDFIILAQYILYDNKTFRYMEYALYKLENTKIPFEHHRLIDSKLCQPTFNYPKLHAISHFIQYIWDYDSAINYNTAHSKMTHKYLLKAFYNRINKKGYNSQIRQHNIRHINIIAMKDVIILEKARKKKMLLESIADTTVQAEMAWVLSLIDLARRYNWAMSNADLDAVKELRLTNIKKY